MLMKRRSILHALATVLIGVATIGCGQDVTVTTDSSAPEFCISYYKQCIDPIFQKTFTLTSGSTIQCIDCHAGGPGKSFQINPSPVTDQDWQGNYESARAQAQEGASSRLLLRPLGVNHGIGPKVFVGTGDPDYQRILYWLSSPVDSRGNIDPALDSAQCQAIYAANPCP